MSLMPSGFTSAAHFHALCLSLRFIHFQSLAIVQRVSKDWREATLSPLTHSAHSRSIDLDAHGMQAHGFQSRERGLAFTNLNSMNRLNYQPLMQHAPWISLMFNQATDTVERVLARLQALKSFKSIVTLALIWVPDQPGVGEKNEEFKPDEIANKGEAVKSAKQDPEITYGDAVRLTTDPELHTRIASQLAALFALCFSKLTLFKFSGPREWYQVMVPSFSSLSSLESLSLLFGADYQGNSLPDGFADGLRPLVNLKNLFINREYTNLFRCEDLVQMSAINLKGTVVVPLPVSGAHMFTITPANRLPIRGWSDVSLFSPAILTAPKNEDFALLSFETLFRIVPDMENLTITGQWIHEEEDMLIKPLEELPASTPFPTFSSYLCEDQKFDELEQPSASNGKPRFLKSLHIKQSSADCNMALSFLACSGALFRNLLSLRLEFERLTNNSTFEIHPDQVELVEGYEEEVLHKRGELFARSLPLMPQLRVIQATGIPIINLEIFASNTKLDVLSIWWPHGVDQASEGLERIARSLPNLEHLYVTHCHPSAKHSPFAYMAALMAIPKLAAVEWRGYPFPRRALYRHYLENQFSSDEAAELLLKYDEEHYQQFDDGGYWPAVEEEDDENAGEESIEDQAQAQAEEAAVLT